MKKSPIIKLLELGVCILIIQVAVYICYSLVDSVFTKHKEALTVKEKYDNDLKKINKNIQKTKDNMVISSNQKTLSLAETANNIIG